MDYFLSIFLCLAVGSVFAQAEIKISLEGSDFHSHILSNHLFVDKTDLIKEIMTDGARVTLLAQPRHFGKSLVLSMLEHYLDVRKAPGNSTDIFSNLKITEDRQFSRAYKNRFPVIHVSFSHVTATNFSTAELMIFSIVQKLYSQHSYLLTEGTLKAFNSLKFGMILNRTSSVENAKSAIFSLCDFLGNKKVLRKAGIGVVLLIDDYDKPLQTAYLNNYFAEMSDLLSSVLACLKNSAFVQKAVVAGSYHVALRDLLPKNTNPFTLLNKRHFGFTLSEVKRLIEETPNGVRLEDLCRWYGLDIPVTALNPWSILSCLRNNRKLGPYWAKTSGPELILHLLGLVGMSEAATLSFLLFKKGVVEKGVHKKVTFELLTSEEDYFWTLLVHSGYLSATFEHKDVFRAIHSLRVPNKEAEDALLQWYKRNFSENVRSLSTRLEEFVENILNGKVEKVMEYLAACLKETGIYYDLNSLASERRYHDFLGGIFTPLHTHYVISGHRTEKNLYTGRRRRYDFVLEPKNKSDSGLLLEIVVAKEKGHMKREAEVALGMMKNDKLTANLSMACEKAYAVAVAFSGQSLEFSFEEVPA